MFHFECPVVGGSLSDGRSIYYGISGASGLKYHCQTESSNNCQSLTDTTPVIVIGIITKSERSTSLTQSSSSCRICSRIQGLKPEPPGIGFVPKYSKVSGLCSLEIERSVKDVK